MSVSILRDNLNPLALNDSFIYLTSDKINERNYRFGLHYLYNQVTTSIVGNNIDNFNEGGFIQFTTSDNFGAYKIGDSIYLKVIGVNFIQYNPVPVRIKNIEVVSVNNYKVYIDVDKLKMDSSWWFTAMSQSPSLSTSSFEIYKCITKKVAPNSEGYGIISMNDISRNLLDGDILEGFNPLINYKTLPFEEYLIYLDYDETTIQSPTYNQFKVNNINVFSDKLSFNVGDYVVVDNDNEVFYNGVQKCSSFSFSATDWFFNTDKPALKGVSTSGGRICRADYEATPLTDESDLSSEKEAIYAGLKLKDLSGLNNTEFQSLLNEYLTGQKYLSYAPKKQKTFIEDKGYLSKISSSNFTINYIVVDSLGVEHTYSKNYNSGFNNVASNPDSINEDVFDVIPARGLPVIQECDKSYKIEASGFETYEFEIIKDTKFKRVRLLFADKLGSLNGFNFALFNSRQTKTSKDNYTKELNSFNELDEIKFNDSSRMKVDVATTIKHSLKLNSDFLTQEESDYFEDLISSNNVYAQRDGRVFAVNIDSKSIVSKSKINGLIRYSLDINYSIEETQW